MKITYTPLTDLNTAINEFSSIDLLTNKITMNYDYIQQPENLVQITVPSDFKYRPERIAFMYYGHDSLYPIVLASNNMRSLLEFVPEETNNKIFLLKTDILKNILKI